MVVNKNDNVIVPNKEIYVRRNINVLNEPVHNQNLHQINNINNIDNIKILKTSLDNDVENMTLDVEDRDIMHMSSPIKNKN